MTRLFIAIDLPEDVRTNLTLIAKKLSPFFEGKIVEKNNLHLSLKFLGDVEYSVMRAVIAKLEDVKCKPFHVDLGYIGMFNDRVLWVSLKGIDELQQKVDIALSNLFLKEENFKAHITLARITSKKDSIKDAMRDIMPKGAFEVSEFVLYKSTLTPKGPIYEEVKRFRLK